MIPAQMHQADPVDEGPSAAGLDRGPPVAEQQEPMPPPAKKFKGSKKRSPTENQEPIRRRLRNSLDQGKNIDVLGNLSLPRNDNAPSTFKAPVGLIHQPYVFPPPMKKNRAMKNLQIDMFDDFPSSGELAVVVSGTPSPPTNRSKGSAALSNQVLVGAKSVPIGVQHQADIPEFLGAYDPLQDQQDEQEECMWVPPPKDFEFDPQDFYGKYWKAIWRQFEGHIPFETALQHLMKNRYIFSDSLNTIDRLLLALPQAFKPICWGQAERFVKEIEKPKERTSRRTSRIRNSAMRNYHLSEVQEFYLKWRKLYHKPYRYGRFCNCWALLCEDLAFQPRWACGNCTKHLRPQNAPKTDNVLCLICQTFKMFAGRDRDTENVVFDNIEMAKIEEWKVLEEKSGRAMDRVKYEKLSKKARNARWLKGELTEEEKTMLHTGAIRKVQLSEDEQNQMNCKKLQPFVLPHFMKCNCKIYNGEEEAVKRYGVEMEYSEEEIRVYKAALRWCGGDCKKTAVLLNREPYEINQFCDVSGVSCTGYGAEVSDLPPYIEQALAKKVKKPRGGRVKKAAPATAEREPTPME